MATRNSEGPAPQPQTAGLLWPREHGAYGQVLLPLVTALSSGGANVSAFLIALAAVAVFLSHEAALVLLGQRGPRLRQRRATQARKTLVRLGPVAMLAGLTGLTLAPYESRLAAVLLVPIVLLLVLLIATGREKTTLGELFAAGAAAAAAIPVALAAGVSRIDAGIAWLVWALAFGAVTGGVRWLLTRHKGTRESTAGVLLAACTLLTVGGSIREPILAAALPQVVLAWTLVILSPHPRHLKRVGWSIVVLSLATAIALVMAAR